MYKLYKLKVFDCGMLLTSVALDFGQTLEFRPPEGDLISPLLLCSKNVTMASRLFAGIPHRT